MSLSIHWAYKLSVNFGLTDWEFEKFVYNCMGENEDIYVPCAQALVVFGNPLTIGRLQILGKVLRFPLRERGLRWHSEVLVSILNNCHVTDPDAEISEDDYVFQTALGTEVFLHVTRFIKTDLLGINETDSCLCLSIMKRG